MLPVISIAPPTSWAEPPAAVPSLVRTEERASSTEICVASERPPAPVMVKVVAPTVRVSPATGGEVRALTTVAGLAAPGIAAPV